MIKTEGLTHIHLMVRTLERSLRFYQDVFGMKELFRDGPAMVFLNTPGSRDSITLNEDPSMTDVAGQNLIHGSSARSDPPAVRFVPEEWSFARQAAVIWVGIRVEWGCANMVRVGDR